MISGLISPLLRIVSLSDVWRPSVRDPTSTSVETDQVEQRLCTFPWSRVSSSPSVCVQAILCPNPPNRSDPFEKSASKPDVTSTVDASSSRRRMRKRNWWRMRSRFLRRRRYSCWQRRRRTVRHWANFGGGKRNSVERFVVHPACLQPRRRWRSCCCGEICGRRVA